MSVRENYGDIHLHYKKYPDSELQGHQDCPWNAEGRMPYEALQLPVEPEKCHVEFCHPGTWQGKGGKLCGGKMVATQQPMQMQMQRPMVAAPSSGGMMAMMPPQMQAMMPNADYTMMYLSILALLAAVGFYLIRQRRR